MVRLILLLSINYLILKFQIEYRARRAKEQEARELEKKFGKKKARDIAEQHYQETLEDMQRQDDLEEKQKQEMLRRNRARFVVLIYLLM